MSTSADSGNSILGLIYRAAAWADVAENDTTSPAAVLTIGLHTAAPATSAQTSNEATYGAYAVVPVNRDGTGWSVPAGSSLNNLALIQFLECTSGSNVITHVSVAISGIIIHFGALAASRTVSAGIQPQFAAAALVSTIT